MNDRQVLQLIRMAGEAEGLEPAPGVIARIGDERAHTPTDAEVEALVTARLASMPRPTARPGRWRGSAAALVAASVVTAIFLWPMGTPVPAPMGGPAGGPGGGSIAARTGGATDEATARLADRGVRVEDYERPLVPAPTVMNASQVLVVLRDARAGCGCARVPADAVLGGLGEGSRVVYARAEGPEALSVNDFACFNNSFASGETRANCDGSTVGPSLSVSDFVCFTKKFSGGCM